MGSATVLADGTASRVIRIPELPYGKYEIRVTNHQKTLKDRILVRPSVLEPAHGEVGDTVTVTLPGIRRRSVGAGHIRQRGRDPQRGPGSRVEHR